MRKYLAIDYGSKFIGLAQFHEESDPFPLVLERLANKNESESLKSILKLIQEEFYTDIVFGIPYLTDGSESTSTVKMKKIFKKFEDEILKTDPQIRLYEQDETLTTFQAEEEMKNSPKYNFKVDLKLIDSLSARIILEDFLGQKRED